MKAYSVVGNNKKVTMQINASRLKVVGNNCIVRVTCNQGDIEVIGNNCIVSVPCNQGEIEVIGNDCFIEVADNYGNISLIGANGNVSLGKRWKGDKVNLVGPHRLEVAGKQKPVGYEAQLSPMSPFSKDLDDVIESIFTFVMR